MSRLACTALVLCVSAATLRPAGAADAPADGFVKFLAEREIGRDQRRVLEESGPWDDARQKTIIRVLARLDAPAALEVPWRLRAAVVAGKPQVADELVRIDGRAVFVAPLVLDDAQAALADRRRLDVVRIVAADGSVADVVVPEAPKPWKRWAIIDEPAFVVGLPVSTASFPRPAPPPAGAAAWPDAVPAVLVAATGVGWLPPTPLGRLGMDYGLFASVVDGKKLEPGDTAAFYAMLAAVGRAAPGEIEAAAGRPADIVPIIDPSKKWFESHRGDPVKVSGVARRATRISIDEPWRREQIGADHYWELYVFVETPPLMVNDKKQDDYPIVCCVRTLPDGFPTGDAISEAVTASGFALKRYGYPVAAPRPSSRGRDPRMETALLVGRAATWRPEPSVAGLSTGLSWVFSALAAVIGVAMVYGLWAMNRGGRRTDLPDRVELPDDRG